MALGVRLMDTAMSLHFGVSIAADERWKTLAQPFLSDSSMAAKCLSVKHKAVSSIWSSRLQCTDVRYS